MDILKTGKEVVVCAFCSSLILQNTAIPVCKFKECANPDLPSSTLPYVGQDINNMQFIGTPSVSPSTPPTD